MKNFLCSLRWTHRLGIVALLLGFGALLFGSPYKGSHVTLNMQELSLIVQNKTDHVSVQTLADWIIQGKADFRLIDVRTPAEFAEYHIPGAENLEVADLATAELRRNEKIVIYSEGGIHAAQAWMMLAGRGFVHSAILFGGLEEWKDAILFPRLHENPAVAQQDSIAKIKSVCNFFGGSLQSGESAMSEAATPSAPKLQMPATTNAAPKATTGKKKKEGC